MRSGALPSSTVVCHVLVLPQTKLRQSSGTRFSLGALDRERGETYNTLRRLNRPDHLPVGLGTPSPKQLSVFDGCKTYRTFFGVPAEAHGHPWYKIKG
jgi:hypothetical protein